MDNFQDRNIEGFYGTQEVDEFDEEEEQHEEEEQQEVGSTSEDKVYAKVNPELHAATVRIDGEVYYGAGNAVLVDRELLDRKNGEGKQYLVEVKYY